MARIFIDVHPDGTFTTGTYRGDPVAHAANQDDGVVTYMTECLGELEGFRAVLSCFLNGGGAGRLGERYVGPWRYWGGECIKCWDCWFERVEGFKRRMRNPSSSQRIDASILHALRHGGTVGIGILVNRFRKVRAETVRARIAHLVESGRVTEERYDHPITRVPTTRYRLAQTSLTPS